MTRKEFLNKAFEHATKARELGAPINVPVTVAQAALESNWGKSGLAERDNNLFGIKGEYNGQFGLWPTREQNADGSWVTIEAKFRKYATWTECFQDYGSIIARLEWYRAARENKDDIRAYLHGICTHRDANGKVTKPGWATDHNYYKKVMDVILMNGLDKFGVKEPPVTPVVDSPDDLELLVVHDGPRVLVFEVEKVTLGKSNAGGPKLMVRVKETKLLQRIMYAAGM